MASTDQKLKSFSWPVALLLAGTSVLPAMALAGFSGAGRLFSFLVDWPLPVLGAMAGLGGAVALFLVVRGTSRLPLHLLAGAVMGLGIFFAILFYARWRESMFLIELLLPLFGGGAPGYLLHLLLQRNTGGR